MTGSGFRVRGSGFASGGLVRSALLALMLASSATMAVTHAQDPREILSNAVGDFRDGRFTESVAGFDALAKLEPAQAPQLWQRGIALYYAGRYDDCRRQFESHRTVNPDDVENAAWHFLCVARAESPERARAALLPVGPDRRRPMAEIYQMFRGAMTPERVIAAAGNEAPSRFYAALYAGLYFEALGRKDRALEQIKIAASDEYSRAGGYMHMVAVVHFRTLRP